MVAKKAVEEYVAKLLDIPEAAQRFGFSNSTFLRFRRRHHVATLPGKRVHVDDIISALDRERHLKRAAA